MKDLIQLEKTIKENIKMDNDTIFDILEVGNIFINDQDHECFYIVTYNEESNNSSYLSIIPDMQTNMKDYHFKQNNIINGNEIIDIINKYFNIKIIYESTKDEGYGN